MRTSLLGISIWLFASTATAERQEEAATTVSTPSEQVSSDPPKLPQSFVAAGPEFCWFPGSSTRREDVAAGVTVGGAHVFGSKVGFVLGGRLGIFVPTNDWNHGSLLESIRVDVGLRVNVAEGPVRYGAMLLAVPELLLNNRDTGDKAFALGASAVPYLEVGLEHLQLAFGVARATPLRQYAGDISFSGLWRVDASLLAGVAF